ncbi:MAG: hypothetical protein FD146_1501 [Anaerolineaceae bacterium]|nr:MAG: hypothetical protein FD146_1501 [Anaerolineaceae bacterium]
MDLLSALPYAGGTPPASATGPLDRFLPPFPDGAAAALVAPHAAPGAWLLDPFGAAPRLAVELARAGYRVLVAVNNPITRFLLEMACQPPARSELQAALAELASARKGEERIESHLQSLYQTECVKCRRVVPAEAFVWERGGTVPVSRIYNCPCGESGEHPVTEADQARAGQMSAAAGLHRARALERVAALDDPDRLHVQEALECYLPRAVYALITIANKLDGLSLTPERRRCLIALLLSACDEANTLWPHPTERPRPKQLTVPPRFLEKNIWRSLERGVDEWSGGENAVPLATWPRVPDEAGGVCLYEGPVRALAPRLKEIAPSAIVSVVPRPNQAFWTLSALWAGWLWGREAVAPFKSVLRRRRYDWDWHAAALYAALKNLAAHLPLDARLFALVPEPEPSFLTAVLLAASEAGFDLNGIAIRSRHDPAQAAWNRRAFPRPAIDEIDAGEVRRAMLEYLRARGEPVTYLHLHAAGLAALAEQHALTWKKEALPALNAPITAAIESGAFVHHAAGAAAETGLWALPEWDAAAPSLPDRVEMFLVPFLQKNPACRLPDIETALNAELRGLFTPPLGLVRETLASYAVETDGGWTLRPEDSPSARRADLESAAAQLAALGARLGYAVSRSDQPGRTMLWQEGGEDVYAFYLLASAVAGQAVRQNPHPPERSLLVLPGGRAGLLSAKLRRDPALEALWNRGWRVLKFRQLRRLAESEGLDRGQWEKELSGDPLEPPEQMRMF